MTIFTAKSNLIRILMICTTLWAISSIGARAATATYVIPTNISDTDLASLSTQGDGNGFLVGFRQTLGILLNTRIGGTSGGNISVFTLAPSQGIARATISIGVYNNGNPQFATSRNVRAGNSRSIGNLFSRGCGVLGGCNYIEIFTYRSRRGANGVNVDYITVDGEVVQVTSPTPEPSAWALMIVGFMAVAMRLKALRKRRLQPHHTMPSLA